MFETQQEALREEKLVPPHGQVCVFRYVFPRGGHGTACPNIFPKVGCAGHKEVMMGMVSPKFCLLSFLKQEDQPHLGRQMIAP